METSVPDVKTTSLEAFASQLRSWRLQMNWTQVEMGGKLGYSASLVSGIETMDKAPTADFAARCDELLNTPGTFATLHELVTREAHPAFFAPVIPFEQETVRIHGWALGVVPGLLQTLPFTADNHAGADGPITVYEFAASPSVCYTECFNGGRIVEGREEVADLMTVISLIRASALSTRDSRGLMRRIRSEIGG